MFEYAWANDFSCCRILVESVATGWLGIAGVKLAATRVESVAGVCVGGGGLGGAGGVFVSPPGAIAGLCWAGGGVTGGGLEGGGVFGRSTMTGAGKSFGRSLPQGEGVGTWPEALGPPAERGSGRTGGGVIELTIGIVGFLTLAGPGSGDPADGWLGTKPLSSA